MANANPYHIGQKIICEVRFSDENEQNADPSGVIFRILNLNVGVPTVYIYGMNAELVRDAQGKYHVDFVPTSSGIWAYRFEGTGTVQAPDEKEFIVRESYFV